MRNWMICAASPTPGKITCCRYSSVRVSRRVFRSLKVAYNNVFGYYIEVRNIHKDKVPQEWIRKQTLVNAERYITQGN